MNTAASPNQIKSRFGIMQYVRRATHMPVFADMLPTSVSLWSILMAFFVSSAVGVFFGVYAARKAALQYPIQALRYE
jgi:putative ABC transport system permease protein